MNSDLKKFLKKIKLNEESISMVLGALVIVIVGVLVVNYFKDKNGQTLPTALTTTNETQTAKPGKVHTVKNGETLWSIAEDAYGSGYNWMDIFTENKLKSEGIEIGQKLNIPDVSAKKPTATKKVTTITNTNESEKITAENYTVTKGDSLWKVATRAYGDGNKWVEIARANKLKNPNIIHTGNILTLPR